MTEPGVFETIYSLRSMRRLKPDPIPEETLTRIIEAGTKAPSGGNAQDWHFVVVRDQELKNFIGQRYLAIWRQIEVNGTLPDDAPDQFVRTVRAAAHLAEHIHEAPVLLLACSPKEYGPLAGTGQIRASVVTSHASIYAAVQNILLACRALGIGATLTSIYLAFEDELKAEIGIPEDHEIAAMVPMGYPLGKFGPTSRKPVEDVIHWDRWNHKQA